MPLEIDGPADHPGAIRMPWPVAHAVCKPLVDHRSYVITPRKMGEFIEVFDRLAMPILLATLGAPLGFWTTWVGPQNHFVHLWGYDSLADYEQRCHARDTHPDFADYLAASVHLIVSQQTQLVRAVDPAQPARAMKRRAGVIMVE